MRRVISLPSWKVVAIEMGRASRFRLPVVPHPVAILSTGEPVRRHWIMPRRLVPIPFPLGEVGASLTLSCTDREIVVTGYHVERLQEIRPDDVLAEGCRASMARLDWFRARWNLDCEMDRITGDDRWHTWENNPHVWCVDFAVKS